MYIWVRVSLNFWRVGLGKCHRGVTPQVTPKYSLFSDLDVG